MIIYLKGSDSYRAKKTINELKRKYLEKNPDSLELTEINPETISFNWANLKAVPLFASSRLVIISEASKLTSGQKNDLASYLMGIPSTTVAVVWDGAALSSESLSAVLLGAQKIIDVSLLEGASLHREIDSIAREVGLEADDVTASELEGAFGSDLWAIEQEIKSLSLGAGSSVKKAVLKTPDFIYFRLVRDKNWEAVQKQLSADLLSGRPVELIIGEFAAAIRKELKDKDHRLALGDFLLDIDFALKTGLLDERGAITLLISKLPKPSKMRVEWEGVWQDLAS